MHPEKATIVAEPLSQFREATGQLEVCDPQGRTLGYFLPPEVYRDWRHCREWLYEWAKAKFADETGLDAIRNEPGGYTTPEAIARLAEIAKSGRKAS